MARRFPDLASWRMDEAKSYFEAEGYGLLDRPEVTRHMDVDLRNRQPREDIVHDAGFYRTRADWRNKSPVFYWRAWDFDWLQDDDFVEMFGTYKRVPAYHEFIKSAQRHTSLSDWAETDPLMFNAVRERSLLGDADITGHMLDIRLP